MDLLDQPERWQACRRSRSTLSVDAAAASVADRRPARRPAAAERRRRDPTAPLAGSSDLARAAAGAVAARRAAARSPAPAPLSAPAAARRRRDAALTEPPASPAGARRCRWPTLGRRVLTCRSRSSGRRCLDEWTPQRAASASRRPHRLLVACALFSLVFLVIAGAPGRVAAAGRRRAAHRRAAPTRALRPRAPTSSTATASCWRPTSPAASLYADPQQILDADEAAAGCSRVLPDLNAARAAPRARRRPQLRLAEAPADAAPAVRSQRLGIPGLDFQPEERASIRRAALAAHVVGFTDVDNHGLAGIERSFDERAALAAGAASRCSCRSTCASSTCCTRSCSKAIDRVPAPSAAPASSSTCTPARSSAMVSLPDYDPNTTRRRAAPTTRFNRITARRLRDGLDLQDLHRRDGARCRHGRRSTNALRRRAADPRSARFTDHRLPRRAPLADACRRSSCIRPTSARPRWRWRSAPSGSSSSSRASASLEAGADRAARDRRSRCCPTPWRDDQRDDDRLRPRHRGDARCTLVTAVARMVNGGMLIPPTLSSATPATGRRRPRVISAEDLAADAQADAAHRRPTAPARRPTSPGYCVGGKTGTAEKDGHGRYSQQALLVLLRRRLPDGRSAATSCWSCWTSRKPPTRPGYATGGWVAAPAVGRIVERIAPLSASPPVADDARASRPSCRASRRARRLERAALSMTRCAGPASTRIVDARTPRRRDPEIPASTADSAQVEAGLPVRRAAGRPGDGARFIAEAVARRRRGAAPADDAALDGRAARPGRCVADATRAAPCPAAARFYGAPAANIVVAVTGTNGKTSVADFTRQIWRCSGFRAASLGTLGVVAPAARADGRADHARSGRAAPRRWPSWPPTASPTSRSRPPATASTSTGSTACGSRRRLHQPDPRPSRLPPRPWPPTSRPSSGCSTSCCRPAAPPCSMPTAEFAPRCARCARRAACASSPIGSAGADDRASQQRAATADRPAAQRRRRFGQQSRDRRCRWPAPSRLQCAGGRWASSSAAAASRRRRSPALEQPRRRRPAGMQLVGRASERRAGLCRLRPHARCAGDGAAGAAAARRGRLVVVFGGGGDRDRASARRWARSPPRLADRVIVTDDNPRSEDPGGDPRRDPGRRARRRRDRRPRRGDPRRRRRAAAPAMSWWSPARATRRARSSARSYCRSTTREVARAAVAAAGRRRP